MNRYICIHGHFYQPPRENPWLEEIEMQDGAYPYHDWNERITFECYAPNTASRILDAQKHIVDIVNNYANISFNFGPTLLSWMKDHSPETYQAILKADEISQTKFSGHGSALAQVYNHMIMPLANIRDKRTQIGWGIKDFEFRFKRKPEGMWLAETAVDLESLDLMAEAGVKFTILAPRQAKRIRKLDEGMRWKDVSDGKVDTTAAYLCKLPSGRTISIFFYDGPASQAVAFEGLLNSGEMFARRLISLFDKSHSAAQLVNIATDGETYGHHHRYGDMALTYCLYQITKKEKEKISIYGEFLEKFPPLSEVEIVENSSWSCAHGVERWNADCGCCIGTNPKWNQKWRKPLREALDWLRDRAVSVYEDRMSRLARDPWAARDHYIDVVLDRSEASVGPFFAAHINGDISAQDRMTVMKLLEMQRHALLMYTSCGWFFDEISGIETVQILQYAARVIQLVKEVGGDCLEKEFIIRLEEAPSNLAHYGTGAEVYRQLVKPAVTDLLRVGVHYAVSSLFEHYKEKTTIFSFTAVNQVNDLMERGKKRLLIGRAEIRSNVTFETIVISYAVLHLGDHNLTIGVREYEDEKDFARMHKDLRETFKRSDVPCTIRLIQDHFENTSFSLWHLFKDQQSKILYKVLASTLEEVESSLRKINEYHYPIIQVVKRLRIPLPKVLANTVLVMLNKDLLESVSQDVPNFKRIKELVSEVLEWSLEIDKVTLEYIVIQKINGLMNKIAEDHQDAAVIRMADSIFEALEPLELNLDLWKAQNLYFSIGKKRFKEMDALARQDDGPAREWVTAFNSLGDYLKVTIE